jgi:hypothetical protein
VNKGARTSLRAACRNSLPIESIESPPITWPAPEDGPVLSSLQLHTRASRRSSRVSYGFFSRGF